LVASFFPALDFRDPFGRRFLHQFELARVDISGLSIEREEVPFAEPAVTNLALLPIVSDHESLAAYDAHLVEMSRDNGGMRGSARLAMSGGLLPPLTL
jgi:hypothetical protein